jgi:hypothetical protein
MDEQLLTKARKSHLAVKQALLDFEFFRFFQKPNHFRRKLDRLKRAAPAKYPFERRRSAQRSNIDATMSSGGGGDEVIIAGEQSLTERQERQILCFHNPDSAVPFCRSGDRRY